MSENIQRRVCTEVALILGVDTVTPETRLNLGDRNVGGIRGLYRIANKLQEKFGIRFPPYEPELWTKLNDVIESTELLTCNCLTPTQCQKKRNELLAQARDAEELRTLDGDIIAERCRTLAANLALAASDNALDRKRGLSLYEKNVADFNRNMRANFVDGASMQAQT